MDFESRDYRVLQRLEEKEFVVYEAVSGRLIPGSYPTQSRALWACVQLKEAWVIQCRADVAREISAAALGNSAGGA